MQVMSFYRLLVMFSWICKIMLRSRFMLSFAYLECHCRQPFQKSAYSKTCSPSVTIILYLVVSSALERQGRIAKGGLIVLKHPLSI